MYWGAASGESFAWPAEAKGFTGLGHGQNKQSVTALQGEARARKAALPHSRQLRAKVGDTKQEVAAVKCVYLAGQGLVTKATGEKTLP